jgi:uncharacterized Zn-finger protein
MEAVSAAGHGTRDGISATEGDISMDEPKIIHTETFSCDDDHPIVWYTFDKDGKAMCEYCATHFVYEPKDFHTKMLEEKELLDMSMKESIRQKKERTYSEEMQDKIEPIDDDYVNKILKGSG